MSARPSDASADRLHAIERALVRQASDLALFLVFDRPERERDRPGLWRTYFAQRCFSDAHLDAMINAFRSVGAYVELFAGERAWINALADERLGRLPHRLKAAFNGIGWGVGTEGFMPGRKALVPLVADAYDMLCINADAHACAVTVHKFHSSLVLDGIGIRAPKTWHYHPPLGWVGARPPADTRVIAKSTYEAYSVGVTDRSVFVVDATVDARVAEISEQIGQPVTVQKFIAGREVYIPVWSCPERIISPPIEAVADRAPDDPAAVMTIDDSIRPGGVRYRPFDGPDELIERLAETAIGVVDAFDLCGLSRIDVRVDAQERIWVFDIAVDPGLAVENSLFTSAAEFGFQHEPFLRAVVAATLCAKGLLQV